MTYAEKFIVVIAIKECMARHLLVQIQDTYGRGKLFFYFVKYILQIDQKNLIWYFHIP